MIRKYSKVLIVLLLLIEFTFVFLSIKSFNNKDIKEIKAENKVDKEIFSMYIENNDGKYEEYKDGKSFTIVGYKLNISKSNCVDNKGNLVPDIILSTNNKVTVSSNKTVFCYLYFDQDRSVYGKVVSDYTNSNGVSKISSTSAETGNKYDAYYYTGNITNNNVLYGGFCWKMVITTETNGVKLIYNGTPKVADDGTKSCDNTGANSQLTNKPFNAVGLANSPAYVGYMYNTIYSMTSTGTSLSSTNQILKYQSSMTSSSKKYYFGDSVTFNDSNYYRGYTLNNSSTYTWADSYSDLVGYYTCLSTTESTCSKVYYVAATTSSTMYYFELTDNKPIDDYNITLSSEEPKDNGDGTYTLVNPIEITRSDYYNNFRKYKNYYICNDLNSETCSFPLYLHGTSNTTLYYGCYYKNYKYGNSFKYENGTYTLIDTDTSNIKQFWNWYANYNTLNNNHYTCFNTSGTCTSLYYIYSTSNTVAKYITLTDGKSVSDVIDEMLYAEDVNTTDSTIKDYIDTWYEENLLETKDVNGVLYSNYLENAIFCANREITDLGGWHPNGGVMGSSILFNFDSLECPNKNDRFTLKAGEYGGTEGYGNNALDYPIGLLSYKEVSLAKTTGYLKSGSNYWSISPRNVNPDFAVNIYLSYQGDLIGQGTTSWSGFRPSVSLSTNVEIYSGDGSKNNPYQIGMEN